MNNSNYRTGKTSLKSSQVKYNNSSTTKTISKPISTLKDKKMPKKFPNSKTYFKRTLFYNKNSTLLFKKAHNSKINYEILSKATKCSNFNSIPQTKVTRRCTTNSTRH